MHGEPTRLTNDLENVPTFQVVRKDYEIDGALASRAWYKQPLISDVVRRVANILANSPREGCIESFG